MSLRKSNAEMHSHDSVRLLDNTDDADEDFRTIPPSSNPKNNGHCIPKNFHGVSLIIVGSFFVSFNAFLIKIIKDHGTLELLAFRTLTIVILSLPFVILKKGKTGLEVKHFKIIAIRCAIQITGMLIRFESLRLLPLGIAEVLNHSNIFFDVIFAKVILKEPLTKAAMLSIVLNITGLCLVTRLPLLIGHAGPLSRDTRDYLKGTMYALTAALLMSVSGVLIRHKLKSVDSTFIVFYSNSLIAFVCSCALAIFGGVRLDYECSWKAWLFVGFGFSSFMAQSLLVRTTKTEHLLVSSTLRMSTRLCVAFALQLLIFNDPLDIYNGCGSLIVFLGAIPTILSKWLSSEPGSSRIKETLRCLLT